MQESILQDLMDQDEAEKWMRNNTKDLDKNHYTRFVETEMGYKGYGDMDGGYYTRAERL